MTANTAIDPTTALTDDALSAKKKNLLARFLRYVACTSQSNPKAGVVPSTEGQRELAKILAEELRELGLVDIHLSEYAVLTAKLPSNLPAGKSVKTLGWVAHLDTVDVGLSPDIHPKLVRNYDGGDILQNAEKDLWIRADAHPELAPNVGDDILVSDGTSVLGADDKSAVANVMAALDIVIRENRPHGDIYVAFVPDEEIGLLGAKRLELERFPVDVAYTIDCCALGELVYETFNAGGATVSVKGVPAHPMSSKNVLVNPIMVLHDFISMLDRAETPEHTEMREGFIHVKTIEATPAAGKLTLNIRDHNRAGYEAKKALVRAACEYLKLRHPKAQIELTMADSYANIADSVTEENRSGIDRLYELFDELGIEPNTMPMRGGTDGSFLSTKGLLTPNYFTAGLNFHSRAEMLPLSGWEKSLEVTLALMTAK